MLLTACSRGTGFRFKRMRRAAGLSKEAAALKVGCSYGTLTNYESGRTEPTAQMLLAMSEAYRCSVDDLLGTADEPEEGDAR